MVGGALFSSCDLPITMPTALQFTQSVLQIAAPACIDGIPEGQCPMNDLDELVSSARVDSRQLGNLS